MNYYAALKKVTEKQKSFIRGGGCEDGATYFPQIPHILYKIYISTKILDLSTETRYISFVLFYRYLLQYQIHFMSHQNVNVTTVARKSVENDTFSDTDPQKHLGKVAVASLFLACKIANENRRIRDAINVYHILQFDKLNHNSNGQHCIVEIQSTPPPIDESYWEFKEEIIKIEHHLLRVLNFDVHDLSISPYRIVISILETLVSELELLNNKDDILQLQSDQEKEYRVFFRQLFAKAWRYINDGLFEIDLLVIKNSEFACGALQLALDTTRNSGCSLVDLINQLCWWEWVDVTINKIEEAKLLMSRSTLK